MSCGSWRIMTPEEIEAQKIHDRIMLPEISEYRPGVPYSDAKNWVWVQSELDRACNGQHDWRFFGGIESACRRCERYEIDGEFYGYHRSYWPYAAYAARAQLVPDTSWWLMQVWPTTRPV